MRINEKVYDEQNTKCLMQSEFYPALVRPCLTLCWCLLRDALAQGQRLGSSLRNGDQCVLTHFGGLVILSHQHILSR